MHLGCDPVFTQIVRSDAAVIVNCEQTVSVLAGHPLNPEDIKFKNKDS